MVNSAVKKLVTKSEFSRLCGISATAVTKACSNVLKDAVHGKRIDAGHPAAVKYLEDKVNTPTEKPVNGADPLHDKALKLCTDSGRFTASYLQKNLNIGYARAKRLLVEIEDPSPPKKAPPPPPPPATGHVAKNKSKKAAALANLNNRIENGTEIHEIPEDIKAFADMTLRELIIRFGTETAFKDWLAATKQIEDINEKRLKNATTRGELVNRELIKRGVIEPIDAAHIKLLSDGAKTMARRVVAMTGAGRSVEDCEKYMKDTISSFIRPVKSKVTRQLKNI